MKVGMQEIMQQAQKMQQEFQRVQNELKDQVVSADAGAGLVTVSVNCAHQLQSVSIADELLNPEEKQTLQDLLVAAVNKAMTKANEKSTEEMQKIGGLVGNIPGFNLPS